MLGHYHNGFLTAFHRQRFRRHLERVPLSGRFDAIVARFDVERVFGFRVEHAEDFTVFQNLDFNVLVVGLNHQLAAIGGNANDLRREVPTDQSQQTCRNHCAPATCKT